MPVEDLFVSIDCLSSSDSCICNYVCGILYLQLYLSLLFSSCQTLCNKCSAVAEMGDRSATIDMGQKLGAMPFGGGEVGPHLTMWRGPRPTSLLSCTLIHPALWLQQTWAENWGGAVPLWDGELHPHLTQCGHGRGLLPYQVAS